MNCYEIKDEICFKGYWQKYCPAAGREQARKLWHFSREVADISTDCKKEPMNLNQTFASATTGTYTTDYTICLAPINPQVECQKACSVPCAKKGNNPMYVENDKHIESAKLNYLQDRASIAYGKKRNEMYTLFNLDTPEIPRTPELLVEAITKGAYTIKPKAERNTYDRVTAQIIWRSPDIKADQEGYEKALDDLCAVYQTVKDTIVVGTPAEALAKVKALDVWTPTLGNA